MKDSFLIVLFRVNSEKFIQGILGIQNKKEKVLKIKKRMCPAQINIYRILRLFLQYVKIYHTKKSELLEWCILENNILTQNLQ